MKIITVNKIVRFIFDFSADLGIWTSVIYSKQIKLDCLRQLHKLPPSLDGRG